MDHLNQSPKCCCNTAEKQAGAPPPPPTKAKTALQSFFSTLLSVLIAFFPKCPMCWAAYMSMFGSLSIARLPYMGWLLPVLFVLLGVHMLLLLRRAQRVGYLPFFASLLGALSLITARVFFPAEQGLLMVGMAFIIGGSLLNSLSAGRLRFTFGKQQITQS
ncbi:hypothetical protein [Pedobacter sp. UBA5917]|jgi:hypothetical protein|uniref:hypothetical protein n=1 Tax=Pedobacter sp. UBA5917 TaxID=1947061 RepID=UPI0025F6BFEA|nr:hypothetical protein [Pedobacter sp. UBA5917]